MFGTEQSGTDQTGPFTSPEDERRYRQRADVLLQLAAQMFPLARIIDEDDFLQQWPGRPIYHTPYRAEQRAPGFVVEHDHNGGRWQLRRVVFLFAASETGKNKKESKCA